jgi:hypothetical protein
LQTYSYDKSLGIVQLLFTYHNVSPLSGSERTPALPTQSGRQALPFSAAYLLLLLSLKICNGNGNQQSRPTGLVSVLDWFFLLAVMNPSPIGSVILGDRFVLLDSRIH